MQQFAEMSPFQKAISSFISNILIKTDDMKDLKRVFLALDEDQTGKIKLHELQKHMTQFLASTE